MSASRTERGAEAPWAIAGGALLLAVAPSILFVAHLFHGSMGDGPALGLLALLSIVTGAALTRRRARAELDRLRSLAVPGVLFGLGIAAAAWSLTPWTPGGGHPVWDWADLASAGTLDRSGTVLEILKLLGLGAVFVLGCLSGTTHERARRTVWAVAWVGGVYGLACLLVFSTDRFLMHQGARFAAGFGSANVAGSLFGVLLVLTASLMIRAARRERGSWTARATRLSPLLALSLLFLLCLVLSASRGAFGATLLALVALGISEMLAARRVRWPLVVAGCALVLGTVVLAARGGGLFLDRLSGIAQGDDTRLALVSAHWRAFLDAPLFGYGLGSFSEVNNQIMTSANADALSETMILHNAYLQWLVEGGVVVALPMALSVAAILAATWGRGLRASRSRTLVAGLSASSILLLCHAAIDVTLNTPSMVALWTFLLGTGFALAQAPARRS